MSVIQGKIGGMELTFASVPRGPTGTVHVRLGSGESWEVRWRRDADGLWIETPGGVSGFDIVGETTDDGGRVYRVGERGGPGLWTGLSFLRAGTDTAAATGPVKKKGTRVRSQMPGKIIRVLAKAGDEIQKDQPLLVMEAMKMENEIRALASGKVKEVKVVEGQAVETGADLMILE